MAKAKDLNKYAYQDRVRFHRNIVTGVFMVVSIFLSVSVLLAWVIFPVQVRSVSMEPAIKKGTCFFTTALVKTPNRGDIVLLEPMTPRVMDMPQVALDTVAGFLSARKYFPFSGASTISGNSCLRRVVGIPGDTIYMQNYILYIKPQGEELYLTEYEVIQRSYEARVETAPAGWDIQMGVVGNVPEFTLGEGEYYVLCDNRNLGADSRMWGPVKEENIAGRILMAYSPINRIHFY